MLHINPGQSATTAAANVGATTGETETEKEQQLPVSEAHDLQAIHCRFSPPSHLTGKALPQTGDSSLGVEAEIEDYVIGPP